MLGMRKKLICMYIHTYIYTYSTFGCCRFFLKQLFHPKMGIFKRKNMLIFFLGRGFVRSFLKLYLSYQFPNRTSCCSVELECVVFSGFFKPTEIDLNTMLQIKVVFNFSK